MVSTRRGRASPMRLAPRKQALRASPRPAAAAGGPQVHCTPPVEGRGGVQTRARRRWSARLARNASSDTTTPVSSPAAARRRAEENDDANANAADDQEDAGPDHETAKAVVTPMHESRLKSFRIGKPAMKTPRISTANDHDDHDGASSFPGPTTASSGSSSSRSSSSSSSTGKISSAQSGGTRLTRGRRFSSRLLPTKRRKVEFTSVEIHEMHLTIGESSVPNDGGPPIGISPRLKRSIIHNVDSFEMERLTGRRSADSVGSPLQQRISQERYKIEGRLPAALRREMLARVAAEEEFIARAEAESQEIQRHREFTNMNDPLDNPFAYASGGKHELLLDTEGLASSGTDAIDHEVSSRHKFYGVADLF